MNRVYLNVPENWAEMTDAQKITWSESALESLRSQPRAADDTDATDEPDGAT
jgi:hypothetical protein